MDTIFLNSENSKLTAKLDLRRDEKGIALSNLSIYYIWKNIKSSYNNNKFRISAPTWNDKFDLPDGSYSVSDTQNYFEYLKKKMKRLIIHQKNKKYGNKIGKRITFKIKFGYYLGLLTSETIKLLESTET